MNNEKICEILNDYSEKLDYLLKSLKEERTTLQMEDDSKRKEKKLALIDEKISKLEQLARRLDYLYNYDEIMKQLDSLRDSNENEDEVFSSISTTIESILENVAQCNNLKEDELDNTDEIIRQINRKVTDLQRSERLLSGKESKEIRAKIAELYTKLIALKNYDKAFKQNNQLIELINKVYSSSNEKDKNAKIDLCIDYINSIIDDNLDQVINIDIYEFKKLDKKQKQKKEVKKEKEKKDKKFAKWFKKHWKKITAGVVAVAALATVSTLTYKGIKKLADKMDKENDDTTKDTTENIDSTNILDTTNDRSDILDNIEKVEDPVILALKEKGYNEYNAKLMTENFDDETLKSLLEFYRPEAEKYASSKDFNLDYLEYYENALNKYNTTVDKAVDYVNRSAKILETNFYSEATIDDVCDVVASIDDKTLFYGENANLAQSFNTAFNAIVEDYLFGNITEDDSKKMDAVKYFAKDGTDMNVFLAKYAEIIKNVLANPNVNSYKTELYRFLRIFATSFNGINSDKDALTDNKEFNDAAEVTDLYDWFMAYNSFVSPLYPLAYPKHVELPPTTPIIPEGATQEMIDEAWADLDKEWKRVEEENNQLESKMRALEELQVYMITVLNGPEFDNFCLVNEGLIK